MTLWIGRSVTKASSAFSLNGPRDMFITFFLQHPFSITEFSFLKKILFFFILNPFPHNAYQQYNTLQSRLQLASAILGQKPRYCRLRGLLFGIHASRCVWYCAVFFIGRLLSRMYDFSKNMTNTEVNLLAEGRVRKKMGEGGGGYIFRSGIWQMVRNRAVNWKGWKKRR